ncbi:nuclear transport factor 2 family protein [Neorhizobium sp. DT-125]|uniref:nuclear transport factor 2 family protein n=1 Tax=Neorhizobium sp. DT-125 TaxID=3396163 RepID=UPI003F1DA7E8
MSGTITRALLVAAALFSGAPAMAASPEENRKVIADYYAAYAAGDMGKVADFFADDIEWHIPGHHPLAGTKRGKAEVAASSGSSARRASGQNSSPCWPTGTGSSTCIAAGRTAKAPMSIPSGCSPSASRTARSRKHATFPTTRPPPTRSSGPPIR